MDVVRAIRCLLGRDERWTVVFFVMCVPVCEGSNAFAGVCKTQAFINLHR
jgi:hypothetical protein